MRSRQRRHACDGWIRAANIPPSSTQPRRGGAEHARVAAEPPRREMVAELLREVGAGSRAERARPEQRGRGRKVGHEAARAAALERREARDELPARALRVRDRLVELLDPERPAVGLREIEQHDGRFAARREPVELDRALRVSERELHVGGVVLRRDVFGAAREQLLVERVRAREVAEPARVDREPARRERIAIGEARQARDLDRRRDPLRHRERRLRDRIPGQRGERGARITHQRIGADPDPDRRDQHRAPLRAPAVDHRDPEQRQREPEPALAERERQRQHGGEPRPAPERGHRAREQVAEIVRGVRESGRSRERGREQTRPRRAPPRARTARCPRTTATLRGVARSRAWRRPPRGSRRSARRSPARAPARAACAPRAGRARARRRRSRDRARSRTVRPRRASAPRRRGSTPRARARCAACARRAQRSRVRARARPARSARRAAGPRGATPGPGLRQAGSRAARPGRRHRCRGRSRRIRDAAASAGGVGASAGVASGIWPAAASAQSSGNRPIHPARRTSSRCVCFKPQAPFQVQRSTTRIGRSERSLNPA